MGLHRSQISIGNYAHPLYSFDRFLACAERLHIQNLELWGAGPHFYFYDYSDERAKGFYQKIAGEGHEGDLHHAGTVHVPDQHRLQRSGDAPAKH